MEPDVKPLHLNHQIPQQTWTENTMKTLTVLSTDNFHSLNSRTDQYENSQGNKHTSPEPVLSKLKRKSKANLNQTAKLLISDRKYKPAIITLKYRTTGTGVIPSQGLTF